MSEPFGRYLNVIDVEATCWDGPTPPGETNEIIEIGVCVVDLHERRRVDRAGILVRPERSRVSDFCTRLTGITQSEVNAGVSFREACLELERSFRSASRAWASWGEYDRRQFERQCGAARVPYPFSARHTNAKLAFQHAHALRTKLGMDGALAHARLPLQGRHHRGVDDAWNIAALVLHLIERDGWPAYPEP